MRVNNVVPYNIVVAGVRHVVPVLSIAPLVHRCSDICETDKQGLRRSVWFNRLFKYMN